MLPACDGATEREAAGRFSLYERGIREFRGAWEALTKEAGLPGLLLHDFRRSAVRNMIRCGVPQTAREISGHKTDAVFSRYNIVSEVDIPDAACKIEAGANGRNS